jgi:hypothetical protein
MGGRMEDKRIPKKFLDGKLSNIRPLEKPRTRWVDITWRDTSQVLGIRGWKRQAEDKVVERHLLRESRAQKRL